ncbi:MAG TPA: SUMF1/EgtB/PvdO family nonheme iron enzyme, partial [Nitrospira sp.]|nr:SUMF1/EgtB/PvdO family nonheme iron enzyme [Nitrospira sp.]
MNFGRLLNLLLIVFTFGTIVPDRAAIGARPDTMVLVPAGEFTMGTPAGSGGLPDEHPVRLVYLRSFWIDQYEVTNAAYETFVEATGYIAPANANPASTLWERNRPLPGIEQHPVVNVS